MSYILDALKKSEQERKLGNLPDISSDHQLLQKTHERNLALYITLGVIFFLVIFLVSITFYFLTDPVRFENKTNNENAIANVKTESTYNNEHDYTNEEFETITEEGRVIDSSGAEIIRPSQERRDSLQEQQQADLKKDADLKEQYRDIFQDKTAGNASSQNKDSDTSSDELAAEEINTDLSEPNWDDYVSIAALDPSIKQQIPSITVSTHIYSSVKSFRKVTVNGFSVHSGAEISDGLIVEHILDEGVIFSYKGLYFRMKALEEWEG